MALVDLDHYRFSVRNPSKGLEYELAGAAIRTALSLDTDVIFEGNFRESPELELWLPLHQLGAAEVYCFFMEVSLDETLRRHATRADRRITAERMLELYEYARPIASLEERLLDETLTVEEAVAVIQKTTGL
jgi:hypothetical protein